MSEKQKRFAWARLNADGLLLVGLLLLSSLQLLDPDQSTVAHVLGRAPVLQPVWLVAYGSAGLLMLHGFLKEQTYTEVIGRVLLVCGLILQTLVVIFGVGVAGPTVTGIFTVTLVTTCTWLRISTLRTKHGITVTLPPAKQTTEENEQSQRDRGGEPS